MSNRIFVSYRREDSRGSAGRLYDQLAAHFGRDRIFMDVDTIQPGLDFVDAIESAISKTDVLLVVIGPTWLDVTDADGNRRLDNPEDFVRLEVAAALARNIRVVPVLVESASMPRASDLPDNLKSLSRRNAVEITHARFYTDTQHLIESLELVSDQAEATDSQVPLSSIPASEISRHEDTKSQDTERRLISPLWLILVFVAIAMATIIILLAVIRPWADPDGTEDVAVSSPVRIAPVATPLIEEPTLTTSPSSTPTRSTISTPFATATQTAIVAPVIRVVASRPTEGDLSAVGSIWNLTSTGYLDMQEPGTQMYNLTVRPTDVWRWTFAWCATDQSDLENILAPLSVGLFVDGLPLTSEQVREHEGSTLPTWQCHNWSTILSDWTPGEHIELEVRYELTESIFDGRDSYAPGEYHHFLSVRVDQ
jgi:hypothetical protein